VDKFNNNIKDILIKEQISIQWVENDIVHKIRDLTSIIHGQLVSFSGTVTRTSEIKPELLMGTFRCLLCNQGVPGIEQQ
jgi:DNA replication licensing factor MCM6